MDPTQLQSLLADHQLYHSDLQMDHFITVRAGGTVYGCYKQALRELFKRYRGLKQLYSERELLKVDIDELRMDTSSVSSIKARRAEIRLTQKRMALEDLERNVSDTEREFARFYAQAQSLKAQVGELTPERRAALDRELWLHRLKAMAAVDFITSGRLGVNTVEFVMALPVRERQALLAEIKTKQVIAWFEEQPEVLPAAVPVEFDARKLIGMDP